MMKFLRHTTTPHETTSDRLAAWLITHPKIIGSFFLMVVVVAVATVPRLKSEAGVDIYFDRARPLQRSVDRITNHFVGDDVVFVVYEAADVFSAAALEEARALGNAFEAIRLPSSTDAARFAIDDVHSLTTVDDLVGADDTFRTEPLVPTPVPTHSAALAHIRERASRNPLLLRHLFAPDGQHALIAARLIPDINDDERAIAIDGMRAIIDARHGALSRCEVTGEAAVQLDLARYQIDDVARFIPVVYSVLTLLLFLFLRRWLGLVVSLVSVLVAMLSAFAVLVLIGSSLNSTSALLPPVIMALNVALLAHYFSEYASHDGPRHQVLGALLVPIFTAELTTAIGFAGLASTSIPAVRDFGIAAAAAVGVAFLTTISWIALVTARWSPEQLTSQRGAIGSVGLRNAIASITSWVLKRPVSVALAAIVVAIVMGAGIRRIVIDQNDIEMFSEDAPVRRATAFMDEHLGGSTLIVATVRASTPGAFLEPTELEKLDALARFMEHDVGSGAIVDTPTDFVKLMRRELMGGATEDYRLPDTRQQTAQLLLLNGDDTLREYLDSEHRWARIVARTNEHSARAIGRTYARLDVYLAEHFPASAGYEVIAAAESRLGATLAEELIDGQLASTFWSGIPIIALMFVMLRSLPLGVISIVPNLFPLFLNFGIMGWLGIKLSTSTMTISTVALGIVVDDTVHFLAHVKKELAAGVEVHDAMRETARIKGVGMFGTTLMLSLVFGVLVISRFNPTREFAVLMAIVMVSALLSDLVLMPACIALAHRARLLGRQTNASHARAARSERSPVAP